MLHEIYIKTLRDPQIFETEPLLSLKVIQTSQNRGFFTWVRSVFSAEGWKHPKVNFWPKPNMQIKAHKTLLSLNVYHNSIYFAVKSLERLWSYQNFKILKNEGES